MTVIVFQNMSSDPVEDFTGRTRRQNSSGNNQLRLSDDDEGPKTLFSQLDDTEKETLVRWWHYHAVEN